MTVLGLQRPEQERYITRAELAQLMGVSTSTIRRLEKKGLPRVMFGRQTVRYRASVAVAWARANSG